MPNMYESAGYETYGEAAFPNGVEAQIPAEGSIPRGYVPFDIENTTEGYEIAKATLESYRFYRFSNWKSKDLYDNIY